MPEQGFTDEAFWIVSIILGILTFALRFSFIGMFGAKDPPQWLEKPLKYVPTTVLPALVAPWVVYPITTGGAFDPLQTLAALVALGVGLLTRSLLWTILSGMLSLWALQWLSQMF